MVHTFPKGICLKVNIIERLEYELAYYDSVVHRFNHYTTWAPPQLTIRNTNNLYTVIWYQVFSYK